MNNNKTKKHSLSRIVLFITCFGLMSMAVASFSEENSHDVQIEIDRSLIQNNQYIESKIKGKAEDLLSTLAAYSVSIGVFDSLENPQIMEVMKEACEQNMFLNMAVSDLNGNTKDIHGNTFNTGDRDYFQQALQGKSIISSVLDSRSDGKDSIIYATPIYKNKAMIGVLESSITVESFEDHFNTSGMEVKSKTIITDGNGNLISSDGLEIEGIAALDSQQKELLTKKGVGSLKKEIDGTIQHVYFNLEEVSNWVVFTAVSDQVVSARKNETHELVAVLIARLFVIVGGFGYLMLYWDRQKNVKIKKQMEEMNTVLKHSPGGAICYEKQYNRITLSFVSDGACEIFDIPKKDAQYEMKRGYKHFICKESLSDEMQLNADQILEEVYYKICDKKGKVKWIYDRRATLQDGNTTYIYISLLDISNMMDLQEEVRFGEQRLHTIIEGVDLMYFNYDVEKDIVTMSQGLSKFTGYDGTSLEFKKSIMHRVIKQKTAALDIDRILEYIKKSGENFTVEERIVLANGKKRWVRVKGKISIDKNGNIREIVAVIIDIHDIKKQQQTLEEQTLRDPLTQIYNKVSTENFIRNKLEETKDGYEQALFVIDVDDFKAVNDNYGHLAGDTALSELAFKLVTTFRKDDIVGRIGGDEFAVLMSDVDLRYDMTIEDRAKKLISEIESLSKREEGAKISCSIGIVKYPQDGNTYEELFVKADEALYDMKKSGKSDYRFYQNK